MDAETTATMVGILDLQVILARDGGQWVAQAIQLDYAAAGDTEEDAKARFEAGLTQTIHEHLTMFGSLERFFRGAPRNDWFELIGSGKIQRYHHGSLHIVDKIPAFPFSTVSYMIPTYQSEA